MTYEEFIEKIRVSAQTELGYAPEEITFYPKGYTSDDLKMIRLIKECNHTYGNRDSFYLQEDYLFLRKTGDNKTAFIQRVPVGRLYEEYKKTGFDSVFHRIREQANHFSALNMEHVGLMHTNDYEKIRDQIIVRMKNYDANRRELENGVYKKIGDVALILYQMLGTNGETMVHSLILKDDLVRWNIDRRSAIRNALENTARLFPACLVSIRTGKTIDLLHGKYTKNEISYNDRIILTNSRGTNGSVALFYPETVNKLMELMGGYFLANFLDMDATLIFDLNSLAAVQAAEKEKKDAGLGEQLSSGIFFCNEEEIFPVTTIKYTVDGKILID